MENGDEEKTWESQWPITDEGDSEMSVWPREDWVLDTPWECAAMGEKTAQSFQL